MGFFVLSVLTLLLPGEPLAGAPRADAAPSTEDSWTWRLVPYLFATNLEGTLAVGPLEVETEVDFADLFESLDWGAMVLFEGHRGRWGFALDGAHVELSEDGDSAVASEVDVTLDVLGAVALFQVAPDSPVELALGARYLGLETEVQVGPAESDSDDEIVDGIVGARSTWRLAERWRFGLYGDIGAGDSDLTWQGVANLGYDFGAWGLNLGYRVLAYQFEEGPSDFDMAMKGWLLGIEYRW